MCNFEIASRASLRRFTLRNPGAKLDYVGYTRVDTQARPEYT